ncbi:hypothetical protein CPB85DRAFT_1286112 [Mucidula mucida]|nr:hypothetical protein CPB85DRAFT_1286112 [Mucidula mucida]
MFSLSLHSPKRQCRNPSFSVHLILSRRTRLRVTRHPPRSRAPREAHPSRRDSVWLPEAIHPVRQRLPSSYHILMGGRLLNRNYTRFCGENHSAARCCQKVR